MQRKWHEHNLNIHNLPVMQKSMLSSQAVKCKIACEWISCQMTYLQTGRKFSTLTSRWLESNPALWGERVRASYGVWTASLGLAALHGRSRQTWRGDLVTQEWETGAHWDLWSSECSPGLTQWQSLPRPIGPAATGAGSCQEGIACLWASSLAVCVEAACCNHEGNSSQDDFWSIFHGLGESWSSSMDIP